MFDRISPMGSSIARNALMVSLRTELDTKAAEMSSGVKSDPAGELGIGASLLYQLRADAEQREAIVTAATTARLRTDTMQTALTSIDGILQDASKEILKVQALKGEGMAVLAGQAREWLRQTTDLLNSQHDGKSIFAGADSDMLPLQSADATQGGFAVIQSILDAAVAAKGGPLDAADINSLINDPDGIDAVFSDTHSDPAKNFRGVFYTATPDAEPTRVRIGLRETLTYDVTAEKQAFRDAFKGYAMLSLLDSASSKLTDDAKVAILEEAGSSVRESGDQLRVMAGVFGAKQQQLDRAAAIQKETADAAIKQIGAYESADIYSVAERVNALRIQLEATYSITAKLADLSLVNFLR